MSREDYSSADVKKILEATLVLVKEDEHLGSMFDGNEGTREQIAREIFEKYIPQYKQAVPREFWAVVNIPRIEERCLSAIRQMRGFSYIPPSQKPQV